MTRKGNPWPLPEDETIALRLYRSYSNVAMAQAALTAGVARYGTTQYSIRTRLYKGLCAGTMKVGSLLSDERLKMVLPQACAYCGTRSGLSLDHLVARSRGGRESGDNIVWACRSCNSSKGAEDVLVWYGRRNVFPPVLLLRRYLKLAIMRCVEQGIMDVRLVEAPPGPFTLSAIPVNFPGPDALTLWASDAGGAPSRTAPES